MSLAQDEAAVKTGEQQARRSQLRRAKKLILDGQWEEVSVMTLISVVMTLISVVIGLHSAGAQALQ